MPMTTTVNVTLRADASKALADLDRAFYYPPNRRDRFVMWVAHQLGVRIVVKRRSRLDFLDAGYI